MMRMALVVIEPLYFSLDVAVGRWLERYIVQAGMMCFRGAQSSYPGVWLPLR
jgi:hypothetical protein